MLSFGTKAENLNRLGLVTNAEIAPQIMLTSAQWADKRMECFNREKFPAWISKALIVRSSALNEDSLTHSMAGHYVSVLDVTGKDELEAAIDCVVASFDSQNSNHQILIQPMLENVVCSGVAFSRVPYTGAPYYVVNYDDLSGRTDSVTCGYGTDLKTVYLAREVHQPSDGWFRKVVDLIEELETVFECDSIDIEFALTKGGKLQLLQVRPLVIPDKISASWSVNKLLQPVVKKIEMSSGPHPYLCGAKAVYGIMPDWNPAEIIGLRPKPFALSLYKELITDSIWAYQRENYGYKSLRSFPLLISFNGLPYIDVRVSFNSFLPSTIDNELAEKLVNYYIRQLEEDPVKHDKVEFDIIYSCYTLDLPVRLAKLREYDFSESEIETLTQSLRNLTNRIIGSASGIWKQDIEKVNILSNRQQTILNCHLSPLEKIYWLMEDCKRYGTLPFAGLARAGFIAVQLLHSLVTTKVLSSQDVNSFMGSLDTVSSLLARDLHGLSKTTFLRKYGHLRPGTYDLLSPRYDEAPDQYFDWDGLSAKPSENDDQPFSLNLDQLNRLESLLKEHSIEHDAVSLLNFIKQAIEGREFSKFVFTKSLSEILKLMSDLGASHGIGKQDMAYANIKIIPDLYSTTQNFSAAVTQSIESGKEEYAKSCLTHLPPLITSSADIFQFHMPVNEPNFITLKQVTAEVSACNTDQTILQNKIICIANADPGYDWLFSHKIAGFITMYGGVNSHMAIRSAELGIPAVIGAGEKNYRIWSSAQRLHMDCANQTISVIRQG